MTDTIVIGGSLAQKPMQAGHTWQFLQYLLGFKRLGWDVLFIDQLEPEMCRDGAGQPSTLEQSVNLQYFLDVMEGFGLNGQFALIYNHGERFIGLTRDQVLERTAHAAFLLNVMGFLSNEEILSQARRRVFLDTDPGFGQMWRELGLHDLFQGHDDFVTIGENIGQPNCMIPTCGLEWIITPQPVVLDYWRPNSEVASEWITSIASWRGAYGPIEYHGETFGLRVHEFRKFFELPKLSGQPFQLALDIHSAETKDLVLLAAHGWSLVDPRAVARDPAVYQAYIQGSKAEFMVAKNMYVKANSGWFSERSICYLASGRPVVAQDTGIQDLYPTGEGLLTFTSIEEARVAVLELVANYSRHARAARQLAEEYFNSDKVLSRLLSKLGVA